jgi:hypothetical protein
MPLLYPMRLSFYDLRSDTLAELDALQVRMVRARNTWSNPLSRLWLVGDFEHSLGLCRGINLGNGC